MMAAVLVPYVASRANDLPSILDLQTNGAFGFPQKEAKVIFEDKQLRVSVTNSPKYLFIQVIVWNDGDSSSGQARDGTEVGDFSALMVHLGSGNLPSSMVDRVYFLNPRPGYPGLHVSTIVSTNPRKITFPEKVSKGGGGIRYIETTQKARVRVDTYVIQLKDLKKGEMDSVNLCYVGYSFKPEFRFNSAGYTGISQYLQDDIPIGQYQEVAFDKNANIEANTVKDLMKYR